MRTDNLSKLSRLFWINIVIISLNNIKRLSHIIYTMSSLVYSHVNLHSLVKMLTRLFGFRSATIRRGSFRLAEGKTVNILSTNECDAYRRYAVSVMIVGGKFVQQPVFACSPQLKLSLELQHDLVARAVARGYESRRCFHLKTVRGLHFPTREVLNSRVEKANKSNYR